MRPVNPTAPRRQVRSPFEAIDAFIDRHRFFAESCFVAFLLAAIVVAGGVILGVAP